MELAVNVKLAPLPTEVKAILADDDDDAAKSVASPVVKPPAF